MRCSDLRSPGSPDETVPHPDPFRTGRLRPVNAGPSRPLDIPTFSNVQIYAPSPSLRGLAYPCLTITGSIPPYPYENTTYCSCSRYHAAAPPVVGSGRRLARPHFAPTQTGNRCQHHRPCPERNHPRTFTLYQHHCKRDDLGHHDRRNRALYAQEPARRRFGIGSLHARI